MKILAIDTSSKLCGVCILENEKEIYRLDLETDKSHSIKLMPIISNVLEKTNINLKDINLIVCDKGPGSFTGIRIGVATAKAFFDSLDIPLIGVSSLEALAYNIKKENSLICSILDAKNDNCYYSLYQLKDNKYIEVITPSAETIENTINMLSKYDNIIFVGDGAISFRDIITQKIPNSIFADKELNNINSYSLGLSGYFKYVNNNNNNNNNEEVLPMYLKKPQAQRQLEEKLNGNSNKQNGVT